MTRGRETGKREALLIKLGGSLITNKLEADTPRLDVIERLAREIAAASKKGGQHLVLGHGGGSFGHSAAARYGLNRGPIGPRQVRGVSVTQQRAAALHRIVVGALEKAGTSPFSLAPSSFLVAAAGRPRPTRVEPLTLALELGLLPVVFGDVVLDRAWGASICSTEQAFVVLAKSLQRTGWRVTGALWLGETEGIYDEDGSTIGRIGGGDIGRVLARVGGARGADVTGGMAHRLQTAGTLARLGIPSLIFDGRRPGALRRALGGGKVLGTRIGC